MILFERPTRFAAIAIRIAPTPLDLGADHREAVARHWRTTTAANPALWNGSAFLFDHLEARGDTLHARAWATDYATLLHRLRGDFVGAAFHHVFPVAAVTTRDHRLLVGRQSAKTANAGLSYPPSGSFDADDRAGDRLDPIANMRRELHEEVGLRLDDLEAEAGWWAIGSGAGKLALVKRYRSRSSAADLRAEIGAHDGDGELDRIRTVAFDDPLALEASVPYVPRLLALLAADPGERDARLAPSEKST